MKKNCLVLLLLLCLTACGTRAEDVPAKEPSGLLSGTLYVPEFTAVDLPERFTGGACFSGGKLWLTCWTNEEVETVDDDGNAFWYGSSGSELFQGTPDGKNLQKIPDYRPFELLNGDLGAVDVRKCWPGRDGTVWVHSSVEGERTSGEFVQQFDVDGAELARFDLNALPLEWDGSLATDSEDRLYAGAGERLCVFDRDGQLLCTLGEPYTSYLPLYLLGDGRVALETVSDAPGGLELRTIRPESGEWGDVFPLPPLCGKIYGGSGKWLFLCDSGDDLLGYDAETGEFEHLLSWPGTGIGNNFGGIVCLSALEDGRLAVVSCWEDQAELAFLTPTDLASMPETTVLTFATLGGLDLDTQKNILAFNRTHTDCRIEVLNYSGYGYRRDGAAPEDRLHEDVLAGKLPDLLDVEGVPVGEYGRNGYLEDLLPCIESDPDLGRGALMERVIDTACQDGKLYQAFPRFTIHTAAGKPELVGNGISWTWEDLRDAAERLPEGGTVFDVWSRFDLQDRFLPEAVEGMVDRKAGTVREKAVRSFLAFCAEAPILEGEADVSAAAREGKLLLMPADVGSVKWDLIFWNDLFGGMCGYVGYPREDGGAGSSFCLRGGAAMTVVCRDKKAAWSFLRESFLSHEDLEMEELQTFYGSTFPVNRLDFERLAEPYVGLDGSGRYSADGWDPESGTVPERLVTQEEYDGFIALYNAIDHVYDPDWGLSAIFSEEGAAFLRGEQSLENTVGRISTRAEAYFSENK